MLKECKNFDPVLLELKKWIKKYDYLCVLRGAAIVNEYFICDQRGDDIINMANHFVNLDVHKLDSASLSVTDGEGSHFFMCHLLQEDKTWVLIHD